jgi:hypothetical protein
MGHFHIALEEGPNETFGDYIDTWKMTHFNELFFCEFSLPNGPFQSNNWNQPSGEKEVRRILFRYTN